MARRTVPGGGNRYPPRLIPPPQTNGGGGRRRGGGGGGLPGGPGDGGGGRPGPQPNGGGGNGGGQGGGGNGGGNGRTWGQLGNLEQQARRDVNLGIQPLLDQIARAQTQAQQQYGTDISRVQDIYGALGHELQPLTGQYRQENTQIAGDLQNQLSGLTGMLGSDVQGVPQSEISAGAGLFGSLGAGGLEQLASERARNLDFNTSAQRQGGIESMVAQRNDTTDLQNLLNDFGQQRIDISSSLPAEFQQRLDALRQQMFDRRMQQAQLQLQQQAVGSSNRSNRALGNFLTGQISGNLASSRRRRNGGGGGGGGGGSSSSGSGGGGRRRNGGGPNAHGGGTGGRHST